MGPSAGGGNLPRYGMISLARSRGRAMRFILHGEGRVANRARHRAYTLDDGSGAASRASSCARGHDGGSRGRSAQASRGSVASREEATALRADQLHAFPRPSMQRSMHAKAAPPTPRVTYPLSLTHFRTTPILQTSPPLVVVRALGRSHTSATPLCCVAGASTGPRALPSSLPQYTTPSHFLALVAHT